MSLLQNTNIKKDIENALSHKFSEGVTISNSSSLEGGCINHASRIVTNVGDFFVKWNSNCAPDIFLREQESLIELKKAAGDYLTIPEVFAVKQVDSTPGFLIQEYLPTGSSGYNDEEKLGRGLATIHQFRNKEFGFYNNNYCGATPQNNSWNTSWVEFYRENRINYLLKLIQRERPLPTSEFKIYERLLDRLPKLIPYESVPVLIHGDLWSGNYMVTKKGPALIDPASYYADHEMEMAIMTMFGGFSTRFYDAYNEVNPLPSDWKQRNSLYQLYHVLNHYYLFGVAYQSSAIHIAKSYL